MITLFNACCVSRYEQRMRVAMRGFGGAATVRGRDLRCARRCSSDAGSDRVVIQDMLNHLRGLYTTDNQK